MQKINFNAGPAAMPPEVLHEAAKAIRKYKNSGLSVLELPHRGKDFREIIEESNALVHELCGLGSDYDIIWMQGGGRMQFCLLPMNFLPPDGTAAYIESGRWAADAAEYGKYYGGVSIPASSRGSSYDRLPDWPASLPASLAYVHVTTNNTIYGTQWQQVPRTQAPLVADMSSDILSCRRDYTQYSLIYAVAQKNLGIAGNTMVAVRRDMLEKMVRNLPPMLSYKAQARENSILNTANVFGVYVSLLMLRWIRERGIDTIEHDNRIKADLLYRAIDSSPVFLPHVKEKDHRSLMNVCFTARTPEQEKAFMELCDSNDITGIKGHRSVGGFRVSLYNAITPGDVETLVGLMEMFGEKQ